MNILYNTSENYLIAKTKHVYIYTYILNKIILISSEGYVYLHKKT